MENKALKELAEVKGVVGINIKRHNGSTQLASVTNVILSKSMLVDLLQMIEENEGKLSDTDISISIDREQLTQLAKVKEIDI